MADTKNLVTHGGSASNEGFAPIWVKRPGDGEPSQLARDAQSLIDLRTSGHTEDVMLDDAAPAAVKRTRAERRAAPVESKPKVTKKKVTKKKR